MEGGTGDVDPNTANTSGILGHNFGGDSGTIAWLLTGNPPGFTYQLSGNNLLIKQGATTVVTVTLDPATGAYSVAQNAPIQHEPGGDENDQSFTLTYRITDGDGDTASGTLTINVDDDMPYINPALVQHGVVDEEQLAAGNIGDSYADGGDLTPVQGDDGDLVATGALGVSYGADGPAASDPLTFDNLASAVANVSLINSIGGQIDPATLTSNGATVSYALLNATTLVAYTGSTVPASVDASNVVFSVSLSPVAGGSYTFTLKGNLDYPLGGTEDDLVFGFNFAIRDADGDRTTGNFKITVDDDAPVATGAVADGNVDEHGLPSVQFDFRNLNIAWGADKNGVSVSFATDGNGDPLHPAGITSGGTALEYALRTTMIGEKQLVAFKAGETVDQPVFIVALSSPAVPNYVFTLYQALDHLGANDTSLPLNFTVVATDGDGDSIQQTFTVNVADDVPVAHKDDAVTFDEDSGLHFGNVMANDVQGADGATMTKVTFDGGATWHVIATDGVETAPGSGMFLFTLPGVGAWTFTASGDWTFAMEPNFNGQASFAYIITDGDGDESDPNVTIENIMVINVAAINDAPDISGPISAIVNEDTALALTGLTITDVDAGAGTVTVGLTITNGTISLATTAGLSFVLGDGTSDTVMAFSGSLASVNAAIASISYLPSPNFSGAGQLAISVSDNGNSGAGGPLTDSHVVDITVDPVTDTPTLSVTNADGLEDTAGVPLVISAEVTDLVGTPETIIGYTISGVFNGTLSAGTNTGGGVWTLTPAQIAGLAFIPVANFDGTVDLVVIATAQDGTAAPADSAPQILSVTILPVSDAPTVSVSPASGDEDTAIALSIAPALTDADETITSVVVSGVPVGSVLSDGAGNSFTASSGSQSVDIVGWNLSGLTITPTQDFNGTFDLSVVATSQDDVAAPATSAPVTLQVSVTPVNDLPVAVFDTGTMTEDAGAAIFDVRANDTLDPDTGAPNNVTLGSISVSPNAFGIDASDLLVTVTPDDKVQVQLLGTDWDKLSNGASLAVSINYVLHGDQPSDTSGNQLSLLVTGVNDAPVLITTASPSMSVQEDAPMPLGAVGVPVSSFVDFSSVPGGLDNVSDPDGLVLGIAVTGLNSSNGTWYWSPNNGANWIAINPVSASNALQLYSNHLVYFKPAADFEGTIADAMTFRAWDRSSGTPGQYVNTTVNGGTTPFSVDTDAVSVTVNGVNDPAIISGDTSGIVREAGGINNAQSAEGSPLVGGYVQGELNSTDVDNDDDVWQPGSGAGANGYGSYTVDANGHWTYLLNNAHPAIEALKESETSLTDSFIVYTQDGTAQLVTIQIQGNNDAPYVLNQITDQSTQAGSPFSFTIPANTFADVDGRFDGSSGPLVLSAVLSDYNPLPAWLNFDPNTGTFSGTPPANFAGDLDVRVRAYDGEWTAEDVFTLTITPAPVTVSVAHDNTLSLVPTGWTWLADNGHIYKYVSGDTTWTNAVTSAANQIAGVSYLATVTSAAEDGLIDALLGSSGRTYLGGSDAGTEGTWTWLTGPEAGTVFWQGNSSGSAVNGAFTDWSSGQPSVTDPTGDEDYLATDLSSRWNDVVNNNTSLDIGYTAEAGAPSATYAAINEDAPFTFSEKWLLADDENAPAHILSVSALSSKGAAVSYNSGTGQITYDATGSGTLQALGAGATTTDTFTYTIDDGQGGTSTATVTVNVAGVNDAPVANDDTLTFVASAPSGTGWVFNPDNGHYYKIVAGNFSWAGAVANAATQSDGAYLLTLTSATEQSFVLSNFSLGQMLWLGGSDSASEGTWMWMTGPEAGTPISGYLPWNIGEPNNWGGDEDYLALNRFGGADFNTPLWNDAGPTDGSMSAYIAEWGGLDGGVSEDASKTFSTSLLLANDTDVDGDTLTVTGLGAGNMLSIATAKGATVVLNTGTGQITYDPTGSATLQALNDGETTTDSFQYWISDGHGGVASATATLTVNGANDAAVITGAATGAVLEAIAGGSAGTPIATGDLNSTDLDNPNDAWTVVTTATASTNGYGTYTINAAGQWVYTLDNTNPAVNALNTGQSMTDTFTVNTIDGTASQVTITINGATDPSLPATTNTYAAGTSGAGNSTGSAFDLITGRVYLKSNDPDIGNADTRPSISVTATTTNNQTDYYRLTVAQNGTQVWFDVDHANLDTWIRLLASNGSTVLAQNDDNPNGADAGSNDGLDSFLSVTLNAGTYYLQVGRFNPATSNFGSFGASNQTYELHVSIVPPAGDPIVLDLGNPGISFTSLEDGVLFDINGDGTRDQVAWTNGEDGLLVMDLDGSGNIEDGREVFSPVFDGGNYIDGLEALATLDTNGDGMIDANDQVFGSLQLWQDVNQNGVVDAGELRSLTDHGIAGISLNTTPTSERLDGQQLMATGSFTFADGSVGSFVEVDFDKLIAPQQDALSSYQSPSDLTGDDLLHGGSGRDTLIGGAGADTFIFDTVALTDAGAGILDLIADYNFSEGDVIDLSALLGSEPVTDQNAGEYVRTDGNSLSIDIDGAANGENFVAIAEFAFSPGHDALRILVDDASHSSVTI